jgi:hypothetical protein
MGIARTVRSAGMVFAVLILFAAAGTHTAYAQNQTKLKAIRAEVDRIDLGQAKLKALNKKLEGISVGAEGTWYLDQDRLSKMVAVIIGNTGGSENEYYFRDDALIFAHHRWAKYDRPATEGPTRAKQIEVSSAYFEGGKCISLVVNGKDVAAGTEEWTEVIGSMMATSALFKSRMENR